MNPIDCYQVPLLSHILPHGKAYTLHYLNMIAFNTLTTKLLLAMNIMQTSCIKTLCTYIDRYNHYMNYMSSQSRVGTQNDQIITFYQKV